MDYHIKTGKEKHSIIHVTQMVWNAPYRDKQHNGYQAIGILCGFDENLDYKDPENEGLYETFFVSGEVLHEGIAEYQKLHPDPSLRIITREDWDKKAADSPSVKAPPKAKQSKKTSKPSLPRLQPPRGNQGPLPLCQRTGGQWGLAKQWVMTV